MPGKTAKVEPSVVADVGAPPEFKARELEEKPEEYGHHRESKAKNPSSFGKKASFVDLAAAKVRWPRRGECRLSAPRTRRRVRRLAGALQLRPRAHPRAAAPLPHGPDRKRPRRVTFWHRAQPLRCRHVGLERPPVP